MTVAKDGRRASEFCGFTRSPYCLCVPKTSSGDVLGHRQFNLMKQNRNLLCTEPLLRHDWLRSKPFSHNDWLKKPGQVRRRADAQNSHPVAIGKTCLYLPNADNHKAGATNRPKINGLILSQTIKNDRRAQYAFHKDYKTARFEPL
jgi:hypothetical protein